MILHICNFLCSLTLIPRDLGLELMRCFLAKTKDNAKATSNIKFSHSCKSWNKIFECFPKNFVTRKWNYKSCRRLRLFVIIRQRYVVYDINVSQKIFVLSNIRRHKLAKFQNLKLLENIQNVKWLAPYIKKGAN